MNEKLAKYKEREIIKWISVSIYSYYMKTKRTKTGKIKEILGYNQESFPTNGTHIFYLKIFSVQKFLYVPV